MVILWVSLRSKWLTNSFELTLLGKVFRIITGLYEDSQWFIFCQPTNWLIISLTDRIIGIPDEVISITRLSSHTTLASDAMLKLISRVHWSLSNIWQSKLLDVTFKATYGNKKSSKRLGKKTWRNNKLQSHNWWFAFSSVCVSARVCVCACVCVCVCVCVFLRFKKRKLVQKHG